MKTQIFVKSIYASLHSKSKIVIYIIVIVKNILKVNISIYEFKYQTALRIGNIDTCMSIL